MEWMGFYPKLEIHFRKISVPLATVFNLSTDEGMVPLVCKEANIKPLFKNGSRNKSDNCGRVSLTLVLCKLLERLNTHHLVDVFVKHNLINTFQRGFLKSRSCLI